MNNGTSAIHAWPREFRCADGRAFADAAITIKRKSELREKGSDKLLLPLGTKTTIGELEGETCIRCALPSGEVWYVLP